MNQNDNQEEFTEIFDEVLSIALDVEPAFDETSSGKLFPRICLHKTLFLHFELENFLTDN